MKSKIRRLLFDTLDTLPPTPARFLSKLLIELQYGYFIKEIMYLTQKYPAKKVSSMKGIESPQNILVVRLDAIGDIVWTTPFFEYLRKAFPKANIDLIVRPVAAIVLQNCPYVNNIYTYDSKINCVEQEKDLKVMREKAYIYMQNLQKTNKAKYDCVFMPREVFLGGGISNLYLAAFSQAPIRIGRSYGTNILEKTRSEYIKPFFTYFTEMTIPQNEVLQILEELNWLNIEKKDIHTQLWLTDQERENAHDFLDDYKEENNAIIVAVALQGSSKNRSWMFSNYIEVFKKLNKYSSRPIYYLLLDAAPLSASQKRQLNSLSNVIDMTGKTSLREGIALISESAVYFGVGTGLMHIAAAFRKPVVELSVHFKNGRPMDSDSSILVGPWGVPNIVLEPPSGIDGCVGWCTASFSHCINQIYPDQAVDALQKIFRCKNFNGELSS